MYWIGYANQNSIYLNFPDCELLQAFGRFLVVYSIDLQTIIVVTQILTEEDLNRLCKFPFRFFTADYLYYNPTSICDPY